MIAKLARFFETEISAQAHPVVSQERPDNLQKNPLWIGQQWSGSDILPGRYRRELKPDTAVALTQRYGRILEMLASLDDYEFADGYLDGVETPRDNREKKTRSNIGGA